MLKTFAKFGFAVLLMIVCSSLIIEMKYSISLPEYMAYSVPLTREEEAYLKEKPVLVYGADREAAPFSFAENSEEEENRCKGLLPDYMSLLAIETGVDIECRPVEQKKILDLLRDETIDMTEFFVDTEYRTGYVATQPLYELKGVLVTRYENRKIRETRDMENGRLAFVEGDFLEEKILEIFPKGMSLEMVRAESVKEALELLMNGEVDAVASNEVTIDYYAEKMKIENSLKRIGGEIYKEDIALAVNVYDRQLCNILNKEILTLKKKGLFAEAQKIWFGNSAPIVTDNISISWAQWIMTVCVAVVLVLMVWESVLNRRIDQKTREIKIQKNNLQVVIDNLNALVAVINGDDVIIQCNEYGKEMLGDKKGGFIGCGVGTIRMLSELLEIYRTSPQEAYYSYANRYYSIFVRVLNPAKSNRLIMIEDCTKKTLAERKLRQESKMIAVGQLSAGLAHEIRNPLGLIRNYSYILQEYVTDDMSSHSLSVIGDSTNRIDNLVENLLNFSRLSNDKAAPVNVERLLETLIELEKKRLEKQKLQVNVFCPKGLTVRTREETLKIVVFNLINNAREAFQEEAAAGGRLTVEVSAEGGNLQIAVEDNGPGMSESIMENIFNPFFTTKDTGTGLGLYIVTSELEKVNGRISVKSAPGEGSRFVVIIPEEAEEVKSE